MRDNKLNQLPLSSPCKDSSGEGPTGSLALGADERFLSYEVSSGQTRRWKEGTGAWHLSHLQRRTYTASQTVKSFTDINS